MIWILVLASLVRAQCPQLCTCGGKSVTCVNRQLENVPSISPETNSLDLTGNLFAHIDVSSYRQLQKLVLDVNKNLEKSEVGLQLPGSLRELSLKNCRLTRLITIDRGKGAIRILNLSNNRLKRIEQFEFAGWSKLEELDLSSNEIVIKQSGNGNFFRDVPKSIKKLILDNNRIQTLQWSTMDELKDLEYLSLRRNDIKQLPKLPSALELRYIDLSQNRINKLESFTFQRMPKLRTLNLAQNELSDGESLSVGALYVDNTALVNLNISHNRISRLEYSLLWQQEKLETLDLSYNNIRSFDIMGKENTNSRGPRVHYDSAWKDVGQLRFLDLSHNNLTRLESNAFKPLRELEQLRLNNNNIGLVEEKSFDGLTSIRQIYLMSNALTDQIEDISPGFSHIKTLELLDLSNNRIGRVSRSVFSSLEKLDFLNLAGNPVAEVEHQAFSEVTQVEIDSSSLLCDCNLQWFTNFVQTSSFSQKAQCRHPYRLAEKPLVDIEANELKCDKIPRPEIIGHPKSRSVEDGHEVQFECKAKMTEVESTEIEWQARLNEGDLWVTLKNDRDLYQINHSRPPSGTLVESLLRLPKVSQEAAGSYRCRVVNSYAKTVSHEAQLIVHKLSVFTTISKNKTVELGDRVKFVCDAVGHPDPEIAWHHSGNTWEHTASDLFDKLDLNNQGTMLIKHVDVEDSGKYTCTAKNSAGLVKHDIFISMPPVPERIMYESTMTSIKGRNAVLDCAYPVAIYPEVSVTWYYNEREINSTSLRHFLTVNKSQTGIHHLLIINEASEADDGLYQCRVHNSVGSATGSIDLKVIESSEKSIDETIPIWIWVVTSIISTFLISSIIWLVIFCRAMVIRKRNQSDSDLGTDETNIPSPMERHLADNRTYHKNKKLDSRMEDSIKTPASSIETADSADSAAHQPLLNPYLSSYQMGPYHQSPYLSYNPFPYPSPQIIPSPYIHPHFYQMSPYLPQSPLVSQTPKRERAKGFGPERTKTEAELPYQPPSMNPPMSVADRAFTLPELDFGGARRATFGGPVFQYAGSEAPGPSRRKPRIRRSDAGGLNRRVLFDKESRFRDDQNPKIADDDGIVNRVLGPVETTD